MLDATPLSDCRNLISYNRVFLTARAITALNFKLHLGTDPSNTLHALRNKPIDKHTSFQQTNCIIVSVTIPYRKPEKWKYRTHMCSNSSNSPPLCFQWFVRSPNPAFAALTLRLALQHYQSREKATKTSTSLCTPNGMEGGVNDSKKKICKLTERRKCKKREIGSIKRWTKVFARKICSGGKAHHGEDFVFPAMKLGQRWDYEAETIRDKMRGDKQLMNVWQRAYLFGWTPISY